MSKSLGTKKRSYFYQVWNDSVVIKDLVKAVCINIFLTLFCLYLSVNVLGVYVKDFNILKGYSLLVGLIGCVTGAIICMRLFKPKRVISTNVDNNEDLYEIISSFVDYGPEHSVAFIPQSSQDELKELGIYELFIKTEQANTAQLKEDN